MRKITILWSVTVAAMIATFGVVPTAAAKKHKEDGGVIMTGDENGNDIGHDGGRSREELNKYEDTNQFPIGRAADEDSSTSVTESSTTVAKTPKQSSYKQHNAKLLNKLGMKRVRTNGGANHHRKRLASQSRSKYAATSGADGKSGSDSQMFIVKLPPHAHFYGDNSATAVHKMSHYPQQHHQFQKQSPYTNMNTVPVGFMSNGKPAKVYHWNLPTIKHALTGGGGRYKGINDVVAGPHNHHQLKQYNQMVDFELPSAAGSKIVPRRTLYYKPRSSGKPMKKSFVNNGKPNGFYVVSSNKNAAAAVPQYHKIVKAYYGSGDD